jgi:hypothetical protein
MRPVGCEAARELRPRYAISIPRLFQSLCSDLHHPSDVTTVTRGSRAARNGFLRLDPSGGTKEQDAGLAREVTFPAVSLGRGYGEAGGEGLFSSCISSESLTHPDLSGSPLSRKRARAVIN